MLTQVGKNHKMYHKVYFIYKQGLITVLKICINKHLKHLQVQIVQSHKSTFLLYNDHFIL